MHLIMDESDVSRTVEQERDLLLFALNGLLACRSLTGSVSRVDAAAIRTARNALAQCQPVRIAVDWQQVRAKAVKVGRVA